MDDLISRKALISEFEWLKSVVNESSKDEIQETIQRIENAPAVDAVILPCKIGQRVWAIRNFKGVKHAESGIVNDMLFTNKMKLQIVVKYVARGEWGKVVFATREEAEAALAKMAK